MTETGKQWIWTSIFVVLAASAVSCDEVPEIPTDAIPDIPVPTNLSAVLGSDGVTLTWEFDGSYNYSGFDVLRSEDDQLTWVKQATVAGPPYVDSNLRTGFTYWYAVAGVDANGVQGKRSAPFPARPALFEVLIDGGARVTRSQEVVLTFTAPALTQNVRFSEDETFATTQWRDFAPSVPFLLSAGDGSKVVWAQFRDEAGSLTESVSSSIDLDTFAQIDSLTFAALTGPSLQDTISPGGTVRFHIVPAGNETGGFAEVSIEGMGSTPVEVFDDGRNGDAAANDGVYQRNYQFALAFRQRSMRMAAVFIDEAQNTSVEREFENNLYMSDPPDSVVLSEITVVSADSLALRWTRSVDDHFVNYSVYRDVASGVDPVQSVLVGSVSDQATTVYIDSGLLQPSTTYYYKVYVINDLDEGAPSNEKSATTPP
jgi:hypothetical protein